MKRFLTPLVALAFCASLSALGTAGMSKGGHHANSGTHRGLMHGCTKGQTYVHGYTRAGKHVKGYCRGAK
ncbi:MAG: hypothetical protein NVS1B6_18850 [Steroidobacteraceae bacterium]